MQNNLRHTQRLALVGAGKDNILHLVPAQNPRALLAQHPAHRVGNIGFAAAVRPHNTGNPILQLNNRAVGKGFKTS